MLNFRFFLENLWMGCETLESAKPMPEFLRRITALPRGHEILGVYISIITDTKEMTAM